MKAKYKQEVELATAKFAKIAHLRTLPASVASKELKRMNNSFVKGSRKVVQGFVKSQLSAIASPRLSCSTSMKG